MLKILGLGVDTFQLFLTSGSPCYSIFIPKYLPRYSIRVLGIALGV